MHINTTYVAPGASAMNVRALVAKVDHDAAVALEVIWAFAAILSTAQHGLGGAVRLSGCLEHTGLGRVSLRRVRGSNAANLVIGTHNAPGIGALQVGVQVDERAVLVAGEVGGALASYEACTCDETGLGGRRAGCSGLG